MTVPYIFNTATGTLPLSQLDDNFTAVQAFTQTGTGAVARTVDAKLKETVSVKDFGAVGDGVTDDTAAIQAAIDHVLSIAPTYLYEPSSLYVPAGVYRILGTLTINNTIDIFGDGPSSIIRTPLSTIAIFTFDINGTTVGNTKVSNLCFLGPLTTDIRSTAIKIIGDNVAYFTNNLFIGLTCSGFNSFYRDEKLPRTTSFGLESSVAWMKFTDLLINQIGESAFIFTNGSGTGNVFSNSVIYVNRNVGALFDFRGNGCAVGDILISQIHSGCLVPGGVFVKVGDNTVYRAQLSITGCQFDGNVDVPISQSAVGSVPYVNINLVGNNFGGNTLLGYGLQPLRNSVIVDRDATQWLSGNTYNTSIVGAIAKDLFLVSLGSYGCAYFKVTVGGLIGGVQAVESSYDFYIKTNNTTMEVVNTESTEGVANLLIITCVSSSAYSATVSIQCTSTGVGTKLDATITAHGNLFKIVRV